MEYGDFITQFNRQVFKLDYRRQLELAIAVCKKLYFDYKHFSETKHWGNPDILLDAIDFCEKIGYDDVNKASIEGKVANIGSITPDMDDFGDVISTNALNACTAVYETLQFLIDQQPKRIYDIGICLVDSIDFKAQEKRDLTDKEIDELPQMIEARNFLVEHSKPIRKTSSSQKSDGITKFSLKKLFGFGK